MLDSCQKAKEKEKLGVSRPSRGFLISDCVQRAEGAPISGAFLRFAGSRHVFGASCASGQDQNDMDCGGLHLSEPDLCNS